DVHKVVEAHAGEQATSPHQGASRRKRRGQHVHEREPCIEQDQQRKGVLPPHFKPPATPLGGSALGLGGLVCGGRLFSDGSHHMTSSSFLVCLKATAEMTPITTNTRMESALAKP